MEIFLLSAETHNPMANASKFPPTRWSVIDAARSNDPAERRQS
jgi:hypothetical protein